LPSPTRRRILVCVPFRLLVFLRIVLLALSFDFLLVIVLVIIVVIGSVLLYNVLPRKRSW
jgi:hypothetical protein